MLFHRPLRQHQPLGHGAIAEAGCQFRQYLAFPGGQSAEHCGRVRLSEQRLHHQLTALLSVAIVGSIVCQPIARALAREEIGTNPPDSVAAAANSPASPSA